MALVVKNLPVSVEDVKRRVRFLVWEDPLERKWQPTPVLLLGELHGQRNLAGYSPWGYKQLDMTEATYIALIY